MVWNPLSAVRGAGIALAAVLVLAMAALGAGEAARSGGAGATATLAVGEVVLGYRELGAGKPLLLLTGYGCTLESWDPVLLADLAERHRLILLDYRGMGASSAGDTPFSIGLFVEDAAGLLRALGIARADVLGWSMGAMTALELALAHPELVDKVVAYGAAASPGPVTAAVEEFRRLSPTEFTARLFPPAYRAAHPEAVSRLPRPSAPPDREIVRRQREALAAWEGFGDRLTGCDKAVLLVVGEEDDVTPPGESRKLAGELRGSWLVRLRGGGHWLMYQLPDTLARLVELFLEVGAGEGS